MSGAPGYHSLIRHRFQNASQRFSSKAYEIPCLCIGRWECLTSNGSAICWADRRLEARFVREVNCCELISGFMLPYAGTFPYSRNLLQRIATLFNVIASLKEFCHFESILFVPSTFTKLRF